MDKKNKDNLKELQKVSLGPLEKIPVGQGFCFIVANQEIAVFRPRCGGIFAIQNRCPHRNAPLADGLVDDRSVICPYHGHKFNLHTGVGSEQGEQVKAYPVQEENGEIILEIKS